MTFHVVPPAHDAASRTAADALYYRRVLHELIAMGVDLARLVHAQAVAADPEAEAEGAADATVAFDRIARTIRRTVGLARRLDEPVASGLGQHSGLAQQRAAARRRIIREVEDAIQRQTLGEEAEELEAELFDRMDGPDLDAEIDHRPLAEIIADISHDLGLAAPGGVNPWKRRTPDDIATLCARALGGGTLGGEPLGPVAEPGPAPDPGPAERPERFFHIVATPNAT